MISTQSSVVGIASCDVCSYRSHNRHTPRHLRILPLLRNPVEIHIRTFRPEFFAQLPYLGKFFANAAQHVERCDVENFSHANEDAAGFDGAAGGGEGEV
jgi:hypothetical protein